MAGYYILNEFVGIVVGILGVNVDGRHGFTCGVQDNFDFMFEINFIRRFLFLLKIKTKIKSPPKYANPSKIGQSR
jgi:gamma-glutamylcysteine synthetase